MSTTAVAPIRVIQVPESERASGEQIDALMGRVWPFYTEHPELHAKSILGEMMQFESVAKAKAEYDRIRREQDRLGNNNLTASEREIEALATAVAVAHEVGYAVRIADAASEPLLQEDPNSPGVVNSTLNQASKEIVVRDGRTVIGQALYIYFVLAQEFAQAAGLYGGSPDYSVTGALHSIIMRELAAVLLGLYSPDGAADFRADIGWRSEHMSALAAVSHIPMAVAGQVVDAAGLIVSTIALYMTGRVPDCNLTSCRMAIGAMENALMEGLFAALKGGNQIANLLHQALAGRGVDGEQDGDEGNGLMFGGSKKPAMVS